MIKWLYGLIIKSYKPIEEQLADAQDRLYDQEYKRGWDYAAHVWRTSPTGISERVLIRKAGNVITPYEIAIYDFLRGKYRCSTTQV